MCIHYAWQGKMGTNASNVDKRGREASYQTPLLKDGSRDATSIIMEPEASLPGLKVPTTCPYPEPYDSSSHAP